MNWMQFLSGSAFLTTLAAAATALWRWVTGRGKQRMDAVAQFQQLSWSEVENMKKVLEAERKERKDEEADSERRMERMEQTILDHVPAILEWMDGGAKPPTPEVAKELRDMLAAIRYQSWERDGHH